ncbi:Hypothetical predicted protein [Cloeon dipterum]|uniref:VPS9 domain-containing protein n=1 Tax=Cloeon dipterum TaxID=197152 RepID=A0A8S1CHS4_9INSE|nr:Hypothetical predicted protein [Cloeon dipterum]
MECTYDEDLNENAFFQLLQTDHQELFQKATLEGWVICVPRAGALPKYPLTDEDFLTHILIPSDELPESHFCSLLDRQVKVLDRVITSEGDDGRTFSTTILFEETCYTSELYKYKVLCLENLLEQHSCSGHALTNSLISLGSLRDCIDFLLSEDGGQLALEKLDEAIQGFLNSQPDLEAEPLQVQRDLTKGLYEHCLSSALRELRLEEHNSKVNRHVLQNARVAVETYMQHGIYKSLIKGIVAATAKDDAKLNKIIRNSVELQLKDLDVRNELYEKIPAAKQELAKIDGFSTVIGKVGCIQKGLAILSGNPANQAVSADDFLPILIFLVVKVSLPNWLAHLTMMRDFNFSDRDENLNSFLVTSLEAALEHVRSGRLFEPLYPEAQSEENTKQQIDSLENVTEYLFYSIKVNNLSKVQDLLTPSSLLDEMFTENLCHPLCNCEKCELEVARQRSSLAINLLATNEKGLTSLHVACKYGRLEITEFLLEIGAQVTSKDLRGNTPLHYTALEGHQHLMLLLLNSRATPNSLNNDGNSPLHLAAQNGHETCVKALIYFCEHTNRPLNVNLANLNGDSPLHHASKWGYEGIVQILLEAGARPDAKNNRKLTPMDLAHSIHISKLLSSAVQPSSRGFRKRLSFIKMRIAAASKLRLDLMDLTLGASSLPNPSKSKDNNHEYGTKPLTLQQNKKAEKLLRAISVGDVRLACYYLGIEGSINHTSAMFHVPCHPLCSCEKCQARERSQSLSEWELVDHHDVGEDMLDPNVCNSEGITPLHAAASAGCADLIPLLICSGASVNIRTLGRGSTPLHLACQAKKVTAMSALLDAPSCDVNAQDSRGNTPLHYAAIQGSAPMTELLLSRMPNLQTKNGEGKTPLEEAEEIMALRVVQLLKGELFTN